MHSDVGEKVRLTKKHIALGALIVAIIGLWWGIETTQASIDYWLEKRETFSKGLNSITIYCKNGGETDGDFRLVLTFVNASFSNQTEKPYVQVDNSTAKFRFLLHKDETNQKRVYFTIHENVERFSIQLSFEKISPILKPNPMYPTALEYKWNEEGHNYRSID